MGGGSFGRRGSSDRQLVAALESPLAKDPSTTWGVHPGHETMPALTASLLRLPGTLRHGLDSPSTR